MNTFDKAFEITIGHEGGYVNDPDDPGGETNFGISKRSYPNVDMKSLTLNEAKEIYLKDYWQKLGCHLLEDFPKIAVELFDTGVNMGIGKAAKIFQEALNLANRNERDYNNITVDGGIGSNTITAFRKNKNKRRLFNIMNLLQGEFYLKLMRGNEVKEKYVGWFDRVEIIKKG